jgi:hypothetical protein
MKIEYGMQDLLAIKKHNRLVTKVLHDMAPVVMEFDNHGSMDVHVPDMESDVMAEQIIPL